MTPTRKKRLYMVLFVLVGAGIAVTLALNAFKQNILFFFTPSEVVAGNAPVGHAFRIGGMVVDNSLRRDQGSLKVRFEITDTAKTVPVEYDGILPDLFREGQGIVSKGELNDQGVFIASEVLAKHDENYMPPEAAHAMKAAKESMKTLQQ